MQSRLIPILWAIVLCPLTAHSQALSQTHSQAPQTSQGAAHQMRNYLQTRAQSAPQHASSWRMWGAFELQHGNLPQARYALSHAVSLDPQNAATQLNFAECLVQLGESQEAIPHLENVLQLAPGTDYATKAAKLLPPSPKSSSNYGTQQVGYEVKRMDGSDVMNFDEPPVFQSVLDESADTFDVPSLFFQMEFGALYNSNITLSPTRRDFGVPQQSSAQGFMNPVMEYRLINNAFWGVGPTFTGFFNMNEDSGLADLNLQSYQPGFFAERTIARPSTILVPRIQYDYTLDQFDGQTFADRHALSASVSSLWDRGDTSVLYWGSNFTNFQDDGATPAESSRDGWTHAMGASHTWPMGFRFLDDITLGGDLEWADVVGENFAYFGGTVYLSGTVPIGPTLWAELEGGWGLRDYYRSQIDPSRNETIWRASAKLTKQLTPHWSVSGVFNIDQFVSDNPQFEAERYIAGLVGGFRW